MSDPALAIQTAVAAALLATPALVKIVGEGVYDLPPGKAQRPYVTIGDDQIVGDGDASADGSEVHVNIHMWATGPSGRVLCKQMAGIIRDALNVELELDGHDMIDWTVEGAHHMRDPDGIGAHSVLTLRYLTEPAA